MAKLQVRCRHTWTGSYISASRIWRFRGGQWASPLWFRGWQLRYWAYAVIFFIANLRNTKQSIHHGAKYDTDQTRQTENLICGGDTNQSKQTDKTTLIIRLGWPAVFGKWVGTNNYNQTLTQKQRSHVNCRDQCSPIHFYQTPILSRILDETEHLL